MKYNMHYKRFRHFGKDKITMDFAFFAIAFNIKKMAAKLLKQGNMPVNGGHPTPFEGSYTITNCLQSTYKPKFMKIAA